MKIGPNLEDLEMVRDEQYGAMKDQEEEKQNEGLEVLALTRRRFRYYGVER